MIESARVKTTSDILKLEKDFTVDDFVPFSNEYYIKILIMAERLLEGKKYLAV